MSIYVKVQTAMWHMTEVNRCQGGLTVALVPRDRQKPAHQLKLEINFGQFMVHELKFMAG